MPYSIPDSQRGYNELCKIWEEIKKIPDNELNKINFIEDKTLINDIRLIIHGKTLSFKYALLTQLLAKLVNPSVNALAIQKQAGIKGSFDARSFCRKTIVRFERDYLGGILGRSGDPYVSKPLRHSMFTLNVIQHIKDKAGWKRLCRILSAVEEKNDQEFTRNLLRQSLLETYKMMMKVRKPQVISREITAMKLKEIIDDFLKTPSEGARIQAIVYALIRVLNRKTNAFKEIRSGKSTIANKYAGRAADIECFNDKGNLEVGIAVTENLDARKLREELDKAIQRNINRYIIVAYKIRISPEKLSVLIKIYERKGIDIVVTNLTYFVTLLTTLFNDDMRKDFLNEIYNVLSELGYFNHLIDWSEILRKRNIIQ